MKSIKIVIASILAFLLCTTSVPFLGSMAQAGSFEDITDSVETSYVYLVHENDEWEELEREDFFKRYKSEEQLTRINLEWLVKDVDVFSRDSFFTFSVPELNTKTDFDLLDKNKNVIGEVSIDKEGKGRVTFSKLVDGDDKQVDAFGVIEINMPIKEQLVDVPQKEDGIVEEEMPIEEQVVDVPEEQNEVIKKDQNGFSAQRAPPNNPLTTFSVDYVVYINGHRTVVDSFDGLSFGAPIPESSYELSEMDGKTFVYWYEEGTPEDQPFNMNSKVTRSLTLVARYANAYYVSFKSVGTDVEDTLVNAGERVTAPSPAPTRRGYSFDYWSKEQNGAVAFSFETPINEPTTLYAVWRPVQTNYRVTYWVEKANMPFGFDEGNHSNYDFVYEETSGSGFSALTETQVTVSQAQAEAVANWNWNMEADDPKYGFVGSKYAWSTTEAVKGDGSTIIKVYFKRYAFNYIFDFSKAGADGSAGSGFWSNERIAKYDRDGEIYNYQRPYPQRMKYGQSVADIKDENGNPLPDLWPGRYADITRGSEPNNIYIGWVMHSDEFQSVGSGWAVNLGVGSITQSVIPNDGTDGSTAHVYPFFTNKRIVFENHTYVERGSWWDSANEGRPSIGLSHIRPNNQTQYYKYEEGFYTLPGFGTGRPKTYAPEGFKSIEFYDNATTYWNLYGNYETDYTAHEWDEARHSETVGNTQYIRVVNYGERLSFNIAFMTNGGSEINAVTYEYAQPLKEKAPTDPTKGNHVFDGWYTDQFLTEKFDWDITMPAKNFVLYAKWIPRDRSVTYMEKDGTELGVDYYENGAIILEPTSATLGGSTDYEIGKIHPEKGTFMGWQWRPGSTYASFDRFGAEIWRDYVLYAQWGGICNATYDAAGGVGVPPVDDNDYKSGTQTQVLDGSMLSKDNMPFVGWRLQDDGSTTRIYSPGARVTLYRDVVFAAVYEPKLATVTSSIDKKVYKKSDGTVENKVNLTLAVPANDTGLETNITTGSDVTSLRYAFIPYDPEDFFFKIDTKSMNKGLFDLLYDSQLSQCKGELIVNPIKSTSLPQEITYQIDMPDNGRIFFWLANDRYVKDGKGFVFEKESETVNALLVNNVYTPIVLKHEGIGKIAEKDDTPLYDPTNVNVVKTNNDSADTGKPLDISLYGLPLDINESIIADPRYGYDAVEIKSYEAVGDVGLPSGIKPFWKFMQPQDVSVSKTMNDALYINDFIHSFFYDRNNLKPAKFLKVNSAKEPITSDIATFVLKSATSGEKVIDVQGNEHNQITLSTTAAEPFIVVPMQYPGRYMLTETKAPSGYNLLTRDIVVEVDNAGVMTASLGVQPLEQAPLTGADLDAYAVAFYIINKTASELPGAGGAGTLAFAISSAFVCFVMAAQLCIRRRRSRV